MMQYDAILSLGSFCQVGAALWFYELKNINTPFDNFGIKNWESIIPILESKFEDYWALENLGIGKAVQELSLKKGKEDLVYKAYDNKYNLVSNHNFDADRNTATELKTYEEFRQNLKFLEDVFLKQCEIYENVCFVLKAMNWPNPEETNVSLESIERLLKVLDSIRKGKDFTVSIAVPISIYKDLQNLITLSEIKNVNIVPWKIAWNNEKNKEWEDLFKNMSIDPDYYWQLVSTIIENPEIDLAKANAL